MLHEKQSNFKGSSKAPTGDDAGGAPATGPVGRIGRTDSGSVLPSHEEAMAVHTGPQVTFTTMGGGAFSTMAVAKKWKDKTKKSKSDGKAAADGSDEAGKPVTNGLPVDEAADGADSDEHEPEPKPEPDATELGAGL